MTYKIIKIKIRWRSKRPIPVKQLVALNVHTNQEYIKYSEMNTWRNRTWVRILRRTKNIPGRTLALITSFPLLCAFSPNKSKNLFPYFHPFSRIYINLPKEPPKSARGKSPLFFFFVFLYKDNKKISLQKNFSDPKRKSTFPSFFFFCNRFPHGNNICAILLKTKSPLFQNSIDSLSK